MHLSITHTDTHTPIHRHTNIPTSLHTHKHTHKPILANLQDPKTGHQLATKQKNRHI